MDGTRHTTKHVIMMAAPSIQSTAGSMASCHAQGTKLDVAKERASLCQLTRSTAKLIPTVTPQTGFARQPWGGFAMTPWGTNRTDPRLTVWHCEPQPLCVRKSGALRRTGCASCVRRRSPCPPVAGSYYGATSTPRSDLRCEDGAHTPGTTPQTSETMAAASRMSIVGSLAASNISAGIDSGGSCVKTKQQENAGSAEHS